MDPLREEMIPALSHTVAPSLPAASDPVAADPSATDPSATDPSAIQHSASRPGAGRVRSDLDRYGPEQKIQPMALDEAFRYCRDLAQAHYENFSVVTRLVPARIRPHLASIYAYCRWSDDLADEMDHPTQALQLLDWWRTQLDACFEGRATHPVFVALRQTVAQYDLKPEPFSDLLSAFVQDQSKSRYDSDSELLHYCQRSANPVGRLVVRLARLSSPQAIAWSDSICTGLQVANFCQDIRLDAQRGRIYWPADRLQELGIEPETLALNAPTPTACRGVMEWTQDARQLLCAGLPLVQQGPLWFARSVQLFARGGLLILRNIDSQQGDVWSRGVTVSKGQKLQLMIRSLLFPRSTSVPSIDQPRLDA